MSALRDTIADWIDGADTTMRPMLAWQFDPRSKYFRPLTIFACWSARNTGAIPAALIERAAVLEMIHNVTLIIDDILDRSDTRRGVETLHKRFGLLPALMAAGYIVAEAYRAVGGAAIRRSSLLGTARAAGRR